MDKNAIKKYAVWARRELIERVSQRAMIYGITAKDAGDPNAESVNGHLLSQAEKRQRQALIRNIKTKGYEQVMEEVAYTWFNRFAALRFMEVNGYLPSHIRVFTNDAGEFKPQILAEAIHLELDGLDMNKVYELESANKSEELFKYLLIVQCNALNSILPGMFQRIEDNTELLLPDYLLREGSVIEQMVTTIPEEDWTDQVQIIGWLYEAYNTELNEMVYDGNMSKSRITKELLPAATTIYTPDWPVRYMVENSLGRLWLEGHPNDALKSEWKYYLDEVDQEAEIRTRMDTIRKEYATLKPEEIRVIDPCMGSGHILCVLFDTLISIYEDYGFTAREAATKIVENNLWGLDIDERAAQLAYFAVMMKARQYDRRFLSRKVKPHVYAFSDSNSITNAQLQNMGASLEEGARKKATVQIMRLIEEMKDAKEYGSILRVSPCNWSILRQFIRSADAEGQLSIDFYDKSDTAERLEHLISLGEALSQRYDVVVTNPPYLGYARFSPLLDRYIKRNYPEVKADLSMVMFYRAVFGFCKEHGLAAFITTSSWMFLASFEKMRTNLNNLATITSLVDYGTELFDGKVGHNAIVSWVTMNGSLDYKMSAVRLVDFCYSRRGEKQDQFFEAKNRFTAKQSNFAKIPGAPIAYWVSEKFANIFVENKKMSFFGKAVEGIKTGENDVYLRYWYEPIRSNTMLLPSENTNARWKAMTKGGAVRKWYGNLEYVVAWGEDGSVLRSAPGSSLPNSHLYGSPALTWTYITLGAFSMRMVNNFVLHNNKGPACYVKEADKWYLLALCNTKIIQKVLSIIAPTIDCKPGNINNLPVAVNMQPEKINLLSKECWQISREEWDSFEISWDFTEHPFITSACLAARNNETITIRKAFDDWKGVAEGRFRKLKENEEELNRLFIETYGLGDELTPEIEDKDVTVRRADLQREIRSFISYAVGCMFGRYTLGERGLIYAGGEWDASKYPQFQPDKDAIIPVCDDEYFKDDIVGRFVKFVEVAFGKETLEENIRFIADALGGKGSSREVLRSYFINDFYADHLKIYQKRPIYWLFDSGKKNGFKCLVYMHRYQPDTIARIRTDYVHEQQSRYRTAIADLEQRINSASTSERVKLSKQLATLQAQAEEIRVYEEKIHHFADQMIKIDLDDGVKHNYEIFKDVLAKIK